MVKIVLAGGAGNVGREVLEALLAEGKHEIKVFSRKEVPDLSSEGVTVNVVDYSDKAALVNALEGVDTVLSFIITFNDPNNQSQINLIDACIEAGVRRFAPSEWATRSHCGMPAYEGKDQVLEFTLFQCGLFLNYFSYPHPSAKFMQIFPMPIDVENCRAIIHKDTKAQITLTSVQDLARIVTKAVDYESAWPEVSGVRANQMPVLDFIKLCEKIRGSSISNYAYELYINAIFCRKKFIVESVEKSDLEKGILTSSWFPVIVHSSVSEDLRDAFSQSYFSAFILALERGGWNASNEWNELLPKFCFTYAEEFLSNVWKHGP
ncbi:NmrA-like family protein [Botrytis cinerea]